MDGRTTNRSLLASAALVALGALSWLGWRAMPPTPATPAIAVDATALGARSLGAHTLESVARPEGRARLDAAQASTSESERLQATSEPPEAATDAAPASGLTVIVTSAGSGTPVRGKHLYVLGDTLRHEWTDEHGRAHFAGVSGALLLGVKSDNSIAEDTFVLAGEAGKARHDLALEVAHGAHVTVSIALTSGASITGHVLDPEGTPVPGFRFLRLGADGDRWVDPVAVTTDEVGAFALEGLAPGWVLLGPDPSQNEVFPYARLELATGEHEHLALQLLAEQTLEVHASLRGATRGEPWRLPVRWRIEREDSLAGHMPTQGNRALGWYDAASPLVISRALRPGAHILSMTASAMSWAHVSLGGATEAPRWCMCIAPRWTVALPFEVASGVTSIEVGALVPDPGEVAELALTLVAPESAAEPSRTRPLLEWRDRSGTTQQSGIMAGEGTTTVSVFVDLDEVPDRSLTILARTGSLPPVVLATITLRPGAQATTVHVDRR